MLFTRCPECDTTFRITNEALEKAHGRVRCGRCSNIFNAHEELSEQPLAERAPQSRGGEASTVATAQTVVAGPTRAARSEPEPEPEPEAEPGPGPDRDPEPEPEHIVLETEPTFAAPSGIAEADGALFGAPARPMWTLEAVEDADDSPLPKAWVIAASIAALLLLAQIVHHFRAELADQPIVGSSVSAAYAALGIDLARTWDVGRYEILESRATTEPGATGHGRLVIRSLIRNNGPRAQPLPFVRLELQDRWQESVGSRVFTARDYAAALAGSMLAPGDTVEAELVVVDPGPDAYGFELDVCVEAQQQYECANDAIFR